MRKGVEQTVKVTLGRLEDGEKLAEAEDGKAADEDGRGRSRPPTVLGMTIGELNDEARTKFGIGAGRLGRRRHRGRRRIRPPPSAASWPAR